MNFAYLRTYFRFLLLVLLRLFTFTGFPVLGCLPVRSISTFATYAAALFFEMPFFLAMEEAAPLKVLNFFFPNFTGIYAKLGILSYRYIAGCKWHLNKAPVIAA
jgi:hypothetical protein